MAIKNLTIRIEEELLKKFHVVAKCQDRSANQQVISMIRKAVQSYEQKYGEIHIDNQD